MILVPKRMNTLPRLTSVEPEVMLEINTTPLIDVMLVLLVMLIITIPAQLHEVDLTLPSTVPTMRTPAPAKIQIDISRQDVISWNGQPVTLAELDRLMLRVAQETVQTEVHVRADAKSRYALFAAVLASSRRAGVGKLAVMGNESLGG